MSREKKIEVRVKETEETVEDAEEATEALGVETGEKAEEEKDEEESSEVKLARAEAQAAEYLDGWQRARAEFANYKRRTERELAERYESAKLEVAARFLPVLDDLERAMENAPEDVASSEWTEGVGLIQRKLRNILDAEGIVEIDALGQPFDPNFHEAVSREENDDYEENHVIDVLQKGYRHGDRVLRPAVVRVAG